MNPFKMKGSGIFNYPFDMKSVNMSEEDVDPSIIHRLKTEERVKILYKINHNCLQVKRGNDYEKTVARDLINTAKILPYICEVYEKENSGFVSCVYYLTDASASNVLLQCNMSTLLAAEYAPIQRRDIYNKIYRNNIAKEQDNSLIYYKRRNLPMTCRAMEEWPAGRGLFVNKYIPFIGCLPDEFTLISYVIKENGEDIYDEDVFEAAKKAFSTIHFFLYENQKFIDNSIEMNGIARMNPSLVKDSDYKVVNRLDFYYDKMDLFYTDLKDLSLSYSQTQTLNNFGYIVLKHNLIKGYIDSVTEIKTIEEKYYSSNPLVKTIYRIYWPSGKTEWVCKISDVPLGEVFKKIDPSYISNFCPLCYNMILNGFDDNYERGGLDDIANKGTWLRYTDKKTLTEEECEKGDFFFSRMANDVMRDLFKLRWHLSAAKERDSGKRTESFFDRAAFLCLAQLFF